MDEMSIAEAAKAIGISVPTVHSLIRKGALTAAAGERGQVIAWPAVRDLIVQRRRAAEANHPEGLEAFARQVSLQVWPERTDYVTRKGELGLHPQTTRVNDEPTADSMYPGRLRSLPEDATAAFGPASIAALKQPVSPGVCRWCAAAALAADTLSLSPSNTAAYRALFDSEPCAADLKRWQAEAADRRARHREEAATRAVQASAAADVRMRLEALRFAEMKLGAPYVNGARGPMGFNCSGLVSWAYQVSSGIDVRNDVLGIMAAGEHVRMDDLEPGDLLLAYRPARGPGHVAFYAGNGQVLEAPRPGGHVRFAPLSTEQWTHAVRPTRARLAAPQTPSAPVSRAAVTASGTREAPLDPAQETGTYASAAREAMQRGDERTARRMAAWTRALSQEGGR